MRRILAFLCCLLAAPSWALSPAQEVLLLGGGGGGPVFYANPAATGIVPAGLSYASAGVRYYFNAAGNLQTSPNNLVLNSAVFATQTIAVTSGARYILSATMASGSSIAVTGGATATLNGSGGTRVFVSFVASSASVTLTLTGSATQSQLELVTPAQTTPNPFMPTSGSAYFGPVVNDHNPATLAALGLRSEPQRTNAIRNNTMQGAVVGTIGSGGVLGTNWTSGQNGGTGLTSAVIAVGVTNGAPAITISVSGTPTSGGNFQITIDGYTGTPAANGQTWTESLSYELASGSMTNVYAVQLLLQEYTSGGAFISSHNAAVAAPSASMSRVSATTTLNQATVGNAIPGIIFLVAAGLPVSFSVTIALPQLEQNAFATSPILTYGTAVSVPADNWSFTGAALALLSSPVSCHAVEFTPEGVNPIYNPTIKSPTTGAFGSIFTNTASQAALTNISVVATNSIVPTAGAKSRIAALGKAGNYAIATNNTLAIGSYATAPTAGAAYYLGQDGVGDYGSMWFSQIMIRPSCTAAQVQRYSTAGAKLGN